MRDTTMVTAGVDHSVLDHSLMVLENEQSRTEDKLAACLELDRYFSCLVKSESDFFPSPFKIHGEKLVKTLLQCLEKGNCELRPRVLLVLAGAVQLSHKGFSMGMHVASQCCALLIKTSRTSTENLELSRKSEALVELFRCVCRFDDPQFLDAVMTIRYSDLKELMEKSVNVCGELIDSNLNDMPENEALNASLRLEALHFAKKLIQICGSLLLIQLEDDFEFWFELLLPQVFVFREANGSAVLKEVNADTRKAAREAVKSLLELVPRDKQLKPECWQRIKSNIKNSYSDKMVNLVGIAPDWAPIWCLMLDVLGAELVRKGNNHLINKLLNVEERAFKYDNADVRVQAFICWRHLIDKLLLFRIKVPSEAVQRSVRLLVQPLQPNNAKTDVMSCQKLITWWHLVQRLEHCMEDHLRTVLVPFLIYCFGCAKSKEIPAGKKYPCLHVPCAKALANILTSEPAKQETLDTRMNIESAKDCIIHPCKVPLLKKPLVFLNVSEELLYSVGECVVILCGRSDVEMCSQLLYSVWNSLLRHIAAVVENEEMPVERVAKLMQDLLRLVQSLAERAAYTSPALATHCITVVLEGLVMGPYALQPAILATPAYYVGTAQLMTGTPALLLLEVMVSRPLLELVGPHSRYVPLLEAILDVGISHHSVLEFMQSVLKQLETYAATCSTISDAERALLCVVWGHIASALTQYLKDNNSVNQGNERHHDLNCFYIVLLFPFYHLYSITYKQTMETVSIWLELYKCFHQAALRDVPTLDINEVCETMAMKVCQALGKQCPSNADQALPLLKAVQNIIMTIPFSDICGTRQSSRRKSRYSLLPDRGRGSKPTNYITNTMNLVVKVSQLFPTFERSGEWYNTVGILVMSCLETLLKNLKTANVAAAVPVVSGLSDSVHYFLQASPLQDETTKFWHESLHRVWKCYFTFIETYLPQKSVKDFLGWMSTLLETGFRHPLQEIQNVTITFWDNIVVPAFARDNTSVPRVLKEAREKCGHVPDTSCVMPHLATRRLCIELEPLHASPFALPEEANKFQQNRRRQSLLQQLQDEGHILTRHQKEVFRRRKDDIPELYNSNIQPVQEDSILSESSQDTSDFTAPQRIIEPCGKSVNGSEDSEPLIASSLKVLEPPSSLRRLADYRKKMMIDLEDSVVLAPINGSDCAVSKSVPEETVSSGTSHEIPETQLETKSEPPNSPLSLMLLSDQCETAPLPSNSRKLNLEFVAVRLPTPILEPSKNAPQLQDALVHEQDISGEPEVAIRVSISTPPSTSVVSNVIDTPVSLPLGEPAVCSDVIVRSIEQGYPEAHNTLSSATEEAELSASSLTILTDKNVSPKMPRVTSTVPGSKSLQLETTNKSNNTGLVQKGSHTTKSPRRKPVIVNTENPLTNYFKPISITLTADDDEIETSGKGGARTIHLSIDSSDSNENVATPVAEPDVCPHSPEAAHSPQQTIPEHTEVLEDRPPTVSSVEILPTRKDCEVSDWRDVLSPLKVVVEKVEDFILTKTFSALETTPPLNVEHDKELAPHDEVSSSSRRKTRSPLKRNPGDPKLPPFKSRNRTIQHIQTKEQCVEAISEDKLPKSGSRLSKGNAREGVKPLKRSSRSRRGCKYGGRGNKADVTARGAVPLQETASADSNSPSLLSTAAASGRTSRSKANQTKLGNSSGKVAENNLAVSQKDKFSGLSAAESRCKPVLHSHGISDGARANRRNSSKSRKPLTIKDLNECGQVTFYENDSLLTCNKEQALGVQIGEQNDDPSNTNVREVSGDADKGGEPSDLASVAVDVEIGGQNVLNSAKTSKVQVEMMETVQKPVNQTASNDATSRSTSRDVRNVDASDQSTFDDSKLLKSNSEARADSVTCTKQNISDRYGALKVSVTKLQVTEAESCTDSVRRAYDEILPSGVKISEPSTSDSSGYIEVVMQNGTVPHLGNSAGTGTGEEEAYSDSVEGQTSHTSSNSKVAKSALSEMNNDPCIEETSKLEEEDEKKVGYSDAGPEPSVRSRKSKLKSRLASLESDVEETGRDKPIDILGNQTNTLARSLGLSAERNKPCVTETQHGERKRRNVQHNHTKFPIEDVCTKSKKRQLYGMGFRNDVEIMQASGRRPRSPLRQSGSDRATDVTDPEAYATSAVASRTENGTTFNMTETNSALTSAEAAVVTADSTMEISFLPASVQDEMKPLQLCDDHIVKEDIPEKLIASVSSFCKEENYPVEKTVSKQRTRSAVNKDKPVRDVMPHRLRSSTSRFSENVKYTISLDASSSKMPLGPEVRANKKVNTRSQISDCSKESGNQTSVEVRDGDVLSQKYAAKDDGASKPSSKASLEPEETISCVPESDINLTSVEIPSGSTGPEGAQEDSQDVVESSQDSSASSTFIVPRFPSIHNCSVSVCRINTSLEAGAKIDIFQGDQKLMVLMPSDSSSPFKVYSPGKVTSRTIQEDKSEKAASEMASGHRTKLLSATRSLYGKSGTSKPFQSAQDKTDVQKESTEGPVCNVGVSRSAQNVPTTRNGIPKQRYKGQKCGDSILNVSKTGAAKPKSTKSVGIITVKECVPAVTAAAAPRARSRRQASARKPEVSFAVINVGGPPKLRQRARHADVPPVTRLKTPIEKHGTREEIVPVTVDNPSVPMSEKQVDNSEAVDSKEQSDLLRTGAITDVTPEFGHKVSEVDVSTVTKEDASEDHPVLLSECGKEGTTKPQSGISICEDVSAGSNENISELQLKKQTDVPRSEDGISSVQKQDGLKPQSFQLINASVTEVNVSVASSEDCPESDSKLQINVSQSENSVSAFSNVDAPKLESNNQINASKSEDNVSCEEDARKLRSRQQLNVSECVDSALRCRAEDSSQPQPTQRQTDISVPVDTVSTVNAEDTPELRFRLQIIASDCADDILEVGKKGNIDSRSKQQGNESSVSSQEEEGSVRPQSIQQNNTSGPIDNILSADREHTQKPQSKQEINAPSSENGSVMAVIEDTSKLTPKQLINASEGDSILTPVKEGVSKALSKQKKGEDCVLTAVKKDTLKPGIQDPKLISLANISECKLKHPVHTPRVDSTVESDTLKSQPDISKAKDRHVSVMESGASEPELSCRVYEENFTVRVIEDAVGLRPDQTATNRETDIEDAVDILGTKVVLQLGPQKAVNREPAKDKMQHSVKRKRVSMNYHKGGSTEKSREKNELKLDHKTSSADDSSLTLQEIADESRTDNTSDVAEMPELKETVILKGDSLLSVPLQSCKRLADSNPTLPEFHQGEADSSHDDHIGTGGSKTRRLSDNAEGVHTKSACDCSPTISPSRVKFCGDGDINRTPSPPSGSARSSPSLFLQALSSPVASSELRNRRNLHRPLSGGRAQYLVGLAVAAKDTETTEASSPVPTRKPKEAGSIFTAATPSLLLSRKKLTYDMSNGNAESGVCERLQGSAAECDTPPPAHISNLADVPHKRTLKQSFGDEGTPPSKKKRVWFPDPEVSGTMLFYAHDTTGRSAGSRICTPCPQADTSVRSRRRAKLHASFNSDTSVHDEGPVSTRSANLKTALRCPKEVSTQSQSSPDVIGLASQGSVEETATELLNTQDAFFPALINCNHPIECVAPRLTTHVMWTKALVVELTRKNICTVGDLSRLDEASINRLPIANPKISHAKAVLQDYMKSLGAENERSPSKKGGANRSDTALEPEQVSSPLAQQISAEDVAKFLLSDTGSLAAVLREASRVSQCGERLRQEMLSVLRGAGNSGEVTEDNVGSTAAKIGKAVAGKQSSDELPQMEVMKYLAKQNPDGLCKVISENSGLASKVSHSYLQSQLESGQLSYRDIFEKLFSTGCKTTLLSAMHSFLMLKTSPEEIMQKLPAESVTQYSTSKLNLVDKVAMCIEDMMGDTASALSVGHCQKLVEAVAKKVTQREFATICYHVTMANLSSE